MRFKLILSLLASAFFFMPILHAQNMESQPSLFKREIKQCRLISSVLERLACYDTINIGEKTILNENKRMTGVAWNRAYKQESARQENNTQFIVTQSEDKNPTVLLTTPALGYHDSRPILMFSCIDNITRLQVALPNPIIRSSVDVVLTTERARLMSQWFVRENYFLLEASRGLDGIKEIQQLFNADTLKIQTKNKEFTDLVFNIKGLEEEIKPLRTACHW